MSEQRYLSPRFLSLSKESKGRLKGTVLRPFDLPQGPQAQGPALLTQYKLHCASTPLFHQNLLPLDEVAFQAVLVMANGEQLQPIVVLDTKTVFEVGSQLFQLLLVAVETEREHQCRSLDHVGVDVEVGADFENGLEIALVHERVSGWRNDCTLSVIPLFCNGLMVFGWMMVAP